MQQGKNLCSGQRNWDLRYDKVFSIIDIQEKNMEKWGSVLPFYQNVQKEGIVLWKAA